jgi:hypothetical protein
MPVNSFARSTIYPPNFDSDVTHFPPHEFTDAQFKARSSMADGCNGQMPICTKFDNHEINVANCLAPKSELYGGFDLSEDEEGGNSGEAKHWIRGAITK